MLVGEVYTVGAVRRDGLVLEETENLIGIGMEQFELASKAPDKEDREFVTGDKVMLVTSNKWSDEDGLEIGEVYTVEEGPDMDDDIVVKEGDNPYWIHAKNFKLAE